MKKMLMTLMIILILFSSCIDRHDPQISDIVDQNSRTVVTIYTDTGQGSGVIATTDGKVITNYHVIQGARSGLVKLTNGNAYDILGVLAMQNETDLAILKIDCKLLPAAVIGDSDGVKQGEEIIIIGSPKGMENTVTTGIISRIGVSMEPIAVPMFQTSAAVDHGHSGSGLFNKKGELIGIVTAKMPDLMMNASFAIPINAVNSLMDINSLKEVYASNDQLRISAGLDKNAKSRGGWISFPLFLSLKAGIAAFIIILLVCYIFSYLGFKASIRGGKSPRGTYRFWTLMLVITGIWCNGYVNFSYLFAGESFGLNEILQKIPVPVNMIFLIVLIWLVILMFISKKED